jgi:hypothetical protein
MLVGILILAYRNFTVEGLYLYIYIYIYIIALTFPYTNVNCNRFINSVFMGFIHFGCRLGGARPN